MKKLLFGIFGVLMLTGCKSLGPTPEQTAGMVEAYRMFSEQPRMGDIIAIKGDATHPATLTVTGTEICISTPLPPLQAIPPQGDRQYDMIEHTVTELSRLGMFAAGAYVLRNSIGQGNTTNIHNDAAATTP